MKQIDTFNATPLSTSGLPHNNGVPTFQRYQRASLHHNIIVTTKQFNIETRISMSVAFTQYQLSLLGNQSNLCESNDSITPEFPLLATPRTIHAFKICFEYIPEAILRLVIAQTFTESPHNPLPYESFWQRHHTYAFARSSDIQELTDELAQWARAQLTLQLCHDILGTVKYDAAVSAVERRLEAQVPSPNGKTKHRLLRWDTDAVALPDAALLYDFYDFCIPVLGLGNAPVWLEGRAEHYDCDDTDEF